MSAAPAGEKLADRVSRLVKEGDAGAWADAISVAEAAGEDAKFFDEVVKYPWSSLTEPDPISGIARTLMMAGKPAALCGVLEAVVCGDGPFHDNASLQNLLLVSELKMLDDDNDRRTRFVGHLQRLHAYSYADIARLLADKGLLDEAFVVFAAFKVPVAEVETILARHAAAATKQLEQYRDAAN